MKKISIVLTIVFLTLMSCNSTKKASSKATSLEGTWELNYITGPRIAFEGLFPNKKPSINFDLKENRVFGNNSCNSYTGKLNIDGNKISFTGPMAVTKMMCMEGMQGEITYMETLQKVDSYTVSEDGKVLIFMMGEIMLLRFDKKM
jgi:heat shock protein HslJ